ncbi:prenylcysteine oxidase 1-like isoform X2 [Rhincodon typus]|uniref:prenylcysteine oxidase 1-like isoform X2 n=1 Tax=Rhincodon typus TaxID=259920 RepID=UPI00202EA2A0|nr:prenylcysteine oxidase 1-like isoform X2 [Rhincodon typus]
MLEVILFWVCVCLAPGCGETLRTDTAPPRNIVVGAGISGCSSAQSLRQVFGSGVRIDVYESETVGGTMATDSLNGLEYEMGASALHPLNTHVKEIARTLGLKAVKLPRALLAVSDGEEMVFEESEWFLVNAIKLVWRYGLDYFRTKTWLDTYLHKFLKVYQLQAHGQCSGSAGKLLKRAGGPELSQLTQKSIAEALRKAGVSQRFLDEMIAPVMRLTYGQATNVSAFAGMMALLAVQSDLWAVEGGNKLLCSGLLYSAKVNLIKGKVTAITTKRRPLRTGEELVLYEVSYEDTLGDGYGLYDIVVVTAAELPMVISGRGSPPAQHQPRVVTLVDSCLNTSSFGHRAPDPRRAPCILTTSRSHSSILAAVIPVSASSVPHPRPQPCARPWKVLSSKPLTQEALSRLFPTGHAFRQASWPAQAPYPLSRQQHPPFAVHRHVYHLSSSGGATGTVELAVIWAKNAAQLAHRRWYEGSVRGDRSTAQGSHRLEL